MANLEAIEGIEPMYAATLREKAGIRSAEALLRVGATPEGRKDLEERTRISGELILGWVIMADLMRIKGVGGQYSELLEKAGVNTAKELERWDPEDLYRKLIEVNMAKSKRLVGRLPTLVMVKGWVEQAKQLPTVITY